MQAIDRDLWLILRTFPFCGDAGALLGRFVLRYTGVGDSTGCGLCCEWAECGKPGLGGRAWGNPS